MSATYEHSHRFLTEQMRTHTSRGLAMAFAKFERDRLIRCLAVGALFASSFGARAESARLESAMEAYVACLIQAAEETDDRESEASSIARAIIPVCSLKFQAVKRTVEREAPTRQERALLLQSLDQRQIEAALSAVRSVRRAKSN